jgi:hypothetical protein
LGSDLSLAGFTGSSSCHATFVLHCPPRCVREIVLQDFKILVRCVKAGAGDHKSVFILLSNSAYWYLRLVGSGGFRSLDPDFLLLLGVHTR